MSSPSAIRSCGGDAATEISAAWSVSTLGWPVCAPENTRRKIETISRRFTSRKTTRSARPSAVSAAGAIFIPPPVNFELETTSALSAIVQARPPASRSIRLSRPLARRIRTARL